MTSGRQKKYNARQASYPHALFDPQLYDFLIAGARKRAAHRKQVALEEIL
jgi:hypothetical protein